MAANRWNVLINLLKDRPHVRGAEVGVQAGKTSRYLLRALPGLKLLYCVDMWRFYPAYESDRVRPGDEWPSQRLMDTDRQKFLTVLKEFGERIELLEMSSVAAAAVVEPESLDFVFIDACHAYEYVQQDIRLWGANVRPGDLIAGHDYEFPSVAHESGLRSRNCFGGVGWGVKRAVDEAFGDKAKVAGAYVWWTVKE